MIRLPSSTVTGLTWRLDLDGAVSGRKRYTSARPVRPAPRPSRASVVHQARRTKTRRQARETWGPPHHAESATERDHGAHWPARARNAFAQHRTRHTEPAPRALSRRP